MTVLPDINVELNKTSITDMNLYLPFDADADDLGENTLTPSVESGGIIFPAHITPQIGVGCVQLAEATTNLITNPSFETNETGWTAGA